MREYETVFVLDVSLEGDAVEGEIDRVVKLIEGQSGKVHDVQKWGRRRLAYAIEKKNDGIYTLVRFDGNGDLVNELDRRFSLNESLLRHMTVVVDHPDARKVGPGVDTGEPRGARDRGGRDDFRREGPGGGGPRRARDSAKPASSPPPPAPLEGGDGAAPVATPESSEEAS